jgi:excisionase family DNA binding protein
MKETATSAKTQGLFTLDEAARELKFTRRTIERKAKSGTIKIVRVFNRPRITGAEIARVRAGDADATMRRWRRTLTARQREGL